jgi:hypothetical protein
MFPTLVGETEREAAWTEPPKPSSTRQAAEERRPT